MPRYLMTIIFAIQLAFSGMVVCGEQAPLLKEKDVPLMMNQIFQYHIDKRQMTPEIMKRAFHVYIEQFDSAKQYLLQSEVSMYENPTDEFLNQAILDYQNGRIPAFIKLNDSLQKAIQRARLWRTEYNKQLPELISKLNTLSDDAPMEEPNYATSEAELKSRQTTSFMRFLKLQMIALGDETFKTKQGKIVKFYERLLQSNENHYLFFDQDKGALGAQEKEDAIVLLVLKSIAKSLDAHSTFFSPSEAYEMKVRLEKGFQGVGVVLQESVDGILVTRLIEGGPAARSKTIQANDIITEVDGVNIVDFSFDKVLDLIRGPEGSTVVFGVERPADKNKKTTASQFKVTLKREPIIVKDETIEVSYESYADGIIGKITLYAFYEGEGGVSSVKDVRDAIRDLKSKGNLKGLVLDLRENTGGFLMQAVKVAGLFITNGVVVMSKYASGEVRYFRDIDGYSYYDGPLVVLTSQTSASAAEIVAQALQDYGVAIVVGDKRTYGKGSIQHQTVTDADGGSLFKVTVGRYYTVSGNSTQIEGVKADVLVPTLYSKQKIGEEFQEYPLSHDQIAPLFDDKLSDLDATAKVWYTLHYLPSLERKMTQWRTMIPQLQKNSQMRLEKNKNFQSFLRKIEGKPDLAEDTETTEYNAEKGKGFGKSDLQMAEAVNIVKDMIIIDSQQKVAPGVNTIVK